MEACTTLFQKYKAMGIDIFQIKQELYINYPKVEIEDTISKTELKIEVQVQIMNTGVIKNFE